MLNVETRGAGSSVTYRREELSVENAVFGYIEHHEEHRSEKNYLSFSFFSIIRHCFMLYRLKLCVMCCCCCLGQDTLVKEIFNLNEAFSG